jgi:CheY-like chemotaxis protein
MALALIASPRDLDLELSRTVLGRRGFERQLATVAEQAQALACARRPDVVLVDVFLAGAEALVRDLRGDPSTRDLSIVALAGERADPREVPILKAGANAVLRLPAGLGWDERLMRFVNVPVRKATRFPVSFGVGTGPVTVPATGLNVGLHGLLVETWAELSLCDEVDLAFRLPGDEAVLHARGRVVRRGAPRQFGVEFTSVDEGARQAIERFVRAV